MCRGCGPFYYFIEVVLIQPLNNNDMAGRWIGKQKMAKDSASRQCMMLAEKGEIECDGDDLHVYVPYRSCAIVA